MPSTSQSNRPVILFTAFEPSGDALAASVIRELRQRHPEFDIGAWGGPKMKDAGANVVECTATDGAMGLDSLSRIRAVRRTMRHIRQWIRHTRVVAHVPVDSPAANFPICRMLRRRGVRTVHLVAPQIWAWGGWRIGKLRRRTDLVLCVLPFEEHWFRQRRVPARFIGHPSMNREFDEQSLRDRAAMLPKGSPRLAILPGSRTQEVRKNIGLLLSVYHELQTRHGDLAGLIVAANERIGRMIRDRFNVLPTAVHIVTLPVEVPIYWCDCALTVSGTVTLDLTRQHKPMVGVYRVGHLSNILSRFILRTKYRLLPNVLAEQAIVPEFAPYSGGPMRIVRAASPLLADSRKRARQSAELREVCRLFDGRTPGVEGAKWIARIAHGEQVE